MMRKNNSPFALYIIYTYEYHLKSKMFLYIDDIGTRQSC